MTFLRPTIHEMKIVDNWETSAELVARTSPRRTDSPQFLATAGPGRQLDDIGPPPRGQNWIVSRKWTLQPRAWTLEYVGN